MKLKQFLTNLDPTAIQISRTKSYSPTLNLCLALTIVIALVLALAYKLQSMINKETIFLSSFESNIRAPVNFSDF